MNESKTITSFTELVLPPTVASKADVSRLLRECEQVDNELTSAVIRTKVDVKEQPKPVISEQLAEFLKLNELTFDTDTRTRTALIKQLQLLKDKAPVLHMTFAVTADPESLQQLVQWLRTSIHPQAVISVGIQPALVAGVYLRTPNHVHDFSLRAKLKSSRDILAKELEAIRGKR